jgi:hypothetical protein
MNMTRREAHRAEIERDHRLVSLSFLHDLETLVDDELARLMVEHASAAPFLLLEKVEALVATCREDLVRLNNERIELRAERHRERADLVPLPEVLAAFRHRGNYHGAFATVADLGRALGAGFGLPEAWMHSTAAAALAEALHRRGEIWTFERNGAVHVFGKPRSTADRILTERARRWADAVDSRAESPLLRLVPQPA